MEGVTFESQKLTTPKPRPKRAFKNVNLPNRCRLLCIYTTPSRNISGTSSFHKLKLIEYAARFRRFGVTYLQKPYIPIWVGLCVTNTLFEPFFFIRQKFPPFYIPS